MGPANLCVSLEVLSSTSPEDAFVIFSFDFASTWSFDPGVGSIKDVTGLNILCRNDTGVGEVDGRLLFLMNLFLTAEQRK